MRLYIVTRFQFLLLFLTFLLAFSIALLIGLSGPQMLQHHTALISELQNKPMDFHTGPFVVSPPPLSLFNQEFWMSIILHPIQLQVQTWLSMRLNVSLEVFASGYDGNQTTPLIPVARRRNKELILHCYASSCAELGLAHLASINFITYVIYVRLNGLPSHKELPEEDKPYPALGTHLFKASNVEFRFHYYNTQFTYLELVLRFTCFFIIELVTILFFGSLKHFTCCTWTIEQKFTAVLLPLAMLFNNPFYPLRYFVNGCFPQLLDDFAHTTFLCTFLLTLLCVYHGLRVSKRRLLGFYLPKAALVGGLWIVLFVLATWRTYHSYEDVTFDSLSEFGGPLYVKVFLGCLGSVYVVFLLVLFFRAFLDLNKLGYYAIRLRTFTGLTVALATAFTVSISLKMAHNRAFASHILSATRPHADQIDSISPDVSWNRNPCELSFLYILTNTILAVMAFVYSPSEDAISDHNFKDNPSVSMINESDDESVVFESDDGSVQLCAPR